MMNQININEMKPTVIEKTSQLALLKGLSALGKFAPKLSTYGAEGVAAFGKGGRQAMLTHMEQWAAPSISKLAPNSYAASHVHKPGGLFSLRGGLGEFAKAVKQGGNGLSMDKSFGANAWQAAKNTGNVLKGQLQDARFKVVAPNQKPAEDFFGKLFPTPEVVQGANGGAVLKGKGLFRGIGDRNSVGSVVDKDGKISYIFKKRKLMQPLSMAATPVGFGAMGAAFEPGGAKEKAKTGVAETAMWTLARPVAEVKMFADIAKPFFNKTNELGG